MNLPPSQQIRHGAVRVCLRLHFRVVTNEYVHRYFTFIIDNFQTAINSRGDVYVPSSAAIHEVLIFEM